MYGGTYAIIVVHATHKWAELGHSHCLYMPAISTIVTTENGTGTKNVLKRNGVLLFVFSIQSSVYYNESKPITLCTKPN